MDYEELESRVRKLLQRYRARCRNISLDDDRLVLGIEGTKADYPNLSKDICKLGLYQVNIAYGRWVFNIQ